MKPKKSSLILSICILFVMIGFDQWTKSAIVHTIPLGNSIEVFHRFLYLTYIQNTGAGFSIFENFGIWFFGVITIIALGVMIYFYFHCDNDLRTQLCLSFVVAGTIGNFIDRLKLGYVRDFFSFLIFGQPFPVFNVADICITVGFAALVIILLYDDWKVKSQWKTK